MALLAHHHVGMKMPSVIIPASGLRRMLIIFLGFVAFSPALRLGFQLDDHITIESNSALRHWDGRTLKDDFFPRRTDPNQIYYRPLQTFVNRLQYSAWKLDPLGYHLTNLVLHMANAVLVAELLIVLSGSEWAALAAGSLFVVHPIIVSELMMVSGIPEIMSFFFSLATLLLFIKKERSYACVGTVCYGLALLSKESSIAVPCYFALLCWTLPKSNDFHAKFGSLLVMTLAYLALRSSGLGNAGISIPTGGSLLTFLVGHFPSILLRYAGLIVFPWHLHSYRLISALNPLWAYAGGLILYAGYVMGRKPRWTLFCAIWFVISFIPKISLMATGHYMLEHWAYPGLLALLLPTGLALAKGWNSPDTTRQRSTTAIFSVMICVLIFSAQFHVAVRGTDEQNYRWSLRFTRATPILFNLGLICLRTGRPAEAVAYIEPIHTLYPEDRNISNALAMAYAMVGRNTDARRRPSP